MKKKHRGPHFAHPWTTWWSCYRKSRRSQVRKKLQFAGFGTFTLIRNKRTIVRDRNYTSYYTLAVSGKYFLIAVNLLLFTVDTCWGSSYLVWLNRLYLGFSYIQEVKHIKLQHSFCNFVPRILNLQIKSLLLTRKLSFWSFLPVWISELADSKSMTAWTWNFMALKYK